MPRGTVLSLLIALSAIQARTAPPRGQEAAPPPQAQEKPAPPPPGPSTKDARDALRPSLVDLAARLLEYAREGDWRRVRLGLGPLRTVSGALDQAWSESSLEALDAAARDRDAGALALVVLHIVELDMRDLLFPLHEDELVEANQARTRLLKAREGLRFLRPVIEARSLVLGDDQRRVEGALLYKLLVTEIGKPLAYLPTRRAYGQHRAWRQSLEQDVHAFLALLDKTLGHHAEPAEAHQAGESDP